MAQPEQDVDLVQRIAAGEDAALQELYAAYGQRMFAFALRLTGDAAMAEDAVQETLVSVWRSAGRYRGEGRVLAWLLGIVHHVALKALRRRPQPITDGMAENLPAGGGLPEDQALVGEQARWVRQGLQSLSAEHRAVLELVFYQGLSLEEVAQVVNCPVGTVKSRLSYARQYLRSVLSRQNVEEWR
ncbi:MAG: sigma-70 family RNA polymerase sigma factor [Anaerolineae bacterium]|nr:sigma-70 family RNA polymerase sigma factor [Anaerolineae bacterium]